jgi:hypothetical protein
MSLIGFKHIKGRKKKKKMSGRSVDRGICLGILSRIVVVLVVVFFLLSIEILLC